MQIKSQRLKFLLNIPRLQCGSDLYQTSRFEKILWLEVSLVVLVKIEIESFKIRVENLGQSLTILATWNIKNFNIEITIEIIFIASS
jgi:hypothetical protein